MNLVVRILKSNFCALILILTLGSAVNAQQSCTNCTPPNAVVTSDYDKCLGVELKFRLKNSGVVLPFDNLGMINVCSDQIQIMLLSDSERGCTSCNLGHTCAFRIKIKNYSNNGQVAFLSYDEALANQWLDFPTSTCGMYKVLFDHVKRIDNCLGGGLSCSINNELDERYSDGNYNRHAEAWICIKTPANAPLITGISPICGPSKVENQMSVVSNGNTYQFQWQELNTVTNLFQDIAGATGTTYLPTSTSFTTKSYQVRVTGYGANNSCPAPTIAAKKFSNTLAIEIFPYDMFGFSGLKQFYCPEDDPTTLQGTPPIQGGEFRLDGTTIGGNTAIFDPKTISAGYHTISYLFPNAPAQCPNKIENKTLVLSRPPLIDRIINSSVTSFSDNWSVEVGDASSALSDEKRNTLTNATSFDNGGKGIWRAEESYAYVENRIQDPTLKINADGIFNNMPMFMFDNGAMGVCYPNWRKMNTMTKYNPSNYETENQDVLGRFSSALYGYKGDLPVATAINAAEYEIGFNGFEEFGASIPLTMQKTISGNLTLLTVAPSSLELQNQSFREYPIEVATDNTITLPIAFTELHYLSNKRIRVYGALLDRYDNKDIYGIYTVSSVSAHGSQAGKTIITLLNFTNSGVWKGKISYSTDLTINPTIPSGTVVKANKAHTGKNSLYVPSKYSIEQPKLLLAQNKSYVISGWLHTDNPLDTVSFETIAGTARGFQLEFYNSATATTPFSSSTTITPAGDIIDGWQRAEGEIQIPIGTVKVVLVLNTGNFPTYFDDIRLFPMLGNMTTYIYNLSNYKLAAELDNNNYATLYHYDEQGNLFLVEKETTKGLMTIQESMSHQNER